MSELEEAIHAGNVQKVRILIGDETYDVNQKIGYEKYERPLSLSLQNIKSENDECFQISRIILEHKRIDVNARCGSMLECTVLGFMCITQCESTLGVKLLLEDRRTDIKGGWHTPLYCALRNIKNKGDYYYKAAE